MNLNIGSQNASAFKTFELVVQVKDIEGNPTGDTKSFVTNEASKLHQFWLRNSGKPKKKKKNKDIGPASNTRQIEEGLKEVENYVKIVRSNRKLED